MIEIKVETLEEFHKINELLSFACKNIGDCEYFHEDDDIDISFDASDELLDIIKEELGYGTL